MIIFLGILPLLNFFLLGDDSLPAKFTSSQFRNTTKTRKYRKIPKISPGAYIFQRPFLRGLFLEVTGNYVMYVCMGSCRGA